MPTKPQRIFTITKVPLHASKQDATYWRDRPMIDRLMALEEIRHEFHQWKYNAEPRFQRLYTITQY